MVLVISILLISVLLLVVSVFLLAMELSAIKRTQHAAISLQLAQQMSSPIIIHALNTVRAASSNGYHPEREHAVLMNGQHAAADELNRYFGHVGELLRRGVADDEVFAAMGPTIGEAWHATHQPFRQQASDTSNANPQDDFEWLYLEWLNWDHRHRMSHNRQEKAGG